MTNLGFISLLAVNRLAYIICKTKQKHVSHFKGGGVPAGAHEAYTGYVWSGLNKHVQQFSVKCIKTTTTTTTTTFVNTTRTLAYIHRQIRSVQLQIS